MREARITVFNSVDASVDQISAPIIMEQVSALSVQAIITGGSSGTLNVLASNEGSNPQNFILIPSATVSITGAGVFLIPVIGISYEWVQIQFVHGNGTAGTLTVNTKSDGY